MRRKFDIHTGNKASYEIFIKENPDMQMSFAQYHKCIRGLNQYYVDHILETGHAVILPNGMGRLCLNKYRKKPKVMPDGSLANYYRINWSEYYKTGVISYHTNEHSDGYSFLWVWYKDHCRHKYMDIWQLQMTRPHKRIIKSIVSDPDKAQMYVHIPSRMEKWREAQKEKELNKLT